jgi:hypothetical protein
VHHGLAGPEAVLQRQRQQIRSVPSDFLDLCTKEGTGRALLLDEEGRMNLALFRVGGSLRRWAVEQREARWLLRSREIDLREAIEEDEQQQLTRMSVRRPVPIAHGGPFHRLLDEEWQRRIILVASSLEAQHASAAYLLGVAERRARPLSLYDPAVAAVVSNEAAARVDVAASILCAQYESHLLAAWQLAVTEMDVQTQILGLAGCARDAACLLLLRLAMELGFDALHLGSSGDKQYVADSRGLERRCAERLQRGIASLRADHQPLTWFFGRWRVGFHCTKSVEALRAIMSDGFDPCRRSGQVYGRGEYFADTVGEALSYNGIPEAPIICALVLDGPHLSLRNGNHYLVVDNDASWNSAFCMPLGYLISTKHADADLLNLSPPPKMTPQPASEP